MCHRVGSLPTRERGLKRGYQSVDFGGPEQVAPHAGAWIETLTTLSSQCSRVSLPTRERGLKQAIETGQRTLDPSLPTRERGLKQALYKHPHQSNPVAPHAGAWIETI